METIKRFSRTVFSTLGAGFSERVYHNSLEVLLKKHNIPFKTEQVIPVMFEGCEVGQVRADLVINGKIVIELKNTTGIKNDHSTQCFMYMKLLKINEGIIINFPKSDDEEVEFHEQKLVEDENTCSRCDREGHTYDKCYAKRDVNGNML
jgi:GxxExxY protein